MKVWRELMLDFFFLAVSFLLLGICVKKKGYISFSLILK